MKSIKEFEDYLITEDGKIFSTKRKKYLKLCKQSSGYFQVHLCKKGKSKGYLVHRLVAISYLNNENNYLCVNHKNGIKTDNRIENLEWISYSDNHKHAFKLGLKVPPMYRCKKVIDLESGEIYDSATHLAKIKGLNKQYVINRLNGRTKNQTLYTYI